MAILPFLTGEDFSFTLLAVKIKINRSSANNYQ
jgi:hypothetical protein